MKTPVIILLLIALAGSAQHAGAQIKSNFSDWNVPPPLPTGTMDKGAVPNKKTVITPLTDVPPVSLPRAGQIKLAELPPIMLTAPAALPPDQPAFPGIPLQFVDIPLPSLPDAIDMPQHVPKDQLNQVITDVPDPADPAMPDFPKIPDAATDKFPNTPTPLPVIPDIPKQVVPAMQPGMFPFTEWSIPPVPPALHFVLVLPPDNSTGIKSRPKTGRKAKKTSPIQ